MKQQGDAAMIIMYMLILFFNFSVITVLPADKDEKKIIESIKKDMEDPSFDINKRYFPYGHTLLFKSVADEHYEVMQFLSDNGAKNIVRTPDTVTNLSNGKNVSIPNGYVADALSYACSKNDEKALKILINNGTNLNDPSGRYENDFYSSSPSILFKLLHTYNYDEVRLALSRGADPNIVSEKIILQNKEADIETQRETVLHKLLDAFQPYSQLVHCESPLTMVDVCVSFIDGHINYTFFNEETKRNILNTLIVMKCINKKYKKMVLPKRLITHSFIPRYMCKGVIPHEKSKTVDVNILKMKDKNDNTVVDICNKNAAMCKDEHIKAHWENFSVYLNVDKSKEERARARRELEQACSEYKNRYTAEKSEKKHRSKKCIIA